MKKHAALLHNAPRGGPGLESDAVLSSRVQSFNLQNSMAGAAEDMSLQNPPKTYGTSVLPMAAASHSQPDLSGTAGFGTRVDSMTRWMTPRRTITIELEEGKRVGRSCFPFLVPPFKCCTRTNMCQPVSASCCRVNFGSS
jgi:hypothetical protein